MDALDFGHGSSSAAAPAAGAASGSTTSAEGWAASQAAAAGPIAATRRPSRLSATLASPTAVQEPAGRPFALQHTGSSALQQLPRIDSVSDVDAKGNASPQPSRTPDKVSLIADASFGGLNSVDGLPASKAVIATTSCFSVLPGATFIYSSCSSINSCPSIQSTANTSSSHSSNNSSGCGSNSQSSAAGSATAEQAKHHPQ